MAGGKGKGSGIKAKDFHDLRRRRNYAVFGGIILLCLVFYMITIIRVGLS